ncbi:hypothetical protein BGX33_000832 [Mortierella sp. NVP41]|nr:hypothetical protein BGX33_000832 [Mortierella sp. NVP41]
MTAYRQSDTIQHRATPQPLDLTVTSYGIPVVEIPQVIIILPVVPAPVLPLIEFPPNGLPMDQVENQGPIVPDGNDQQLPQGQ